MKPIKLCVIGAGSFANSVHGPMLRELNKLDGNLELAAVCDLDAARAEKFAATFGFKRSDTDCVAMLDRERPDGVVVLTGVAATSEIGGRVLAAGYPALLEKPPGRNRAEIEHLIAMRRKGGAPVMVAFNRRYSPWLARAREIVAECGEPLEQVRCDFCRRERLDDDFSTTSIHGIDAVRHLAGGDYRTVRLDYRKLEREKPAWDIVLQAEFDNGVHGLISFSPSTGLVCERFALLTRHWAVLVESVAPGGGSDYPGRISVYRDGKLLRQEALAAHPLLEDYRYLAGYFGEHAEFLNRLRHGFPDEGDLALSQSAVEIADTLRRRESDWRRG